MENSLLAIGGGLALLYFITRKGEENKEEEETESKTANPEQKEMNKAGEENVKGEDQPVEGNIEKTGVPPPSNSELGVENARKKENLAPQQGETYVQDEMVRGKRIIKERTIGDEL